MSANSAVRYLLGVALAVSSLAFRANAQVFQLPTRFDLKPSATPVVPGSVAVDETSLFGIQGDYGFSAAPLDARVGDNPAHDIVDRDDDDRPLLRGCVRLNSGTEFSCLVVPNSLVRVRVLLAHVPFYWKPGKTSYDSFPTALYGIDVLASEGSALKSVAAGIDLRTPYSKAKLTTTLGSYRKVWFTAKADAQGKLRVKFNGATGSPIPVSAIELYPFVPAPITYKRGSGSWLTSTSGTTIPGLAEFNVRNLPLAHSKFLALTDPLTRANALLWLAGWFDGSENGYTTALAEAKAALGATSLASNARAIEYRDRIADYEVAELHFSLRNYEKAWTLPPQGDGYFNPAYPGSIFAEMPTSSANAARHLYLAENIYYQVASMQTLAPVIQWNSNTQQDARFEVFPLAFRALFRVGELHYAMNSLHSYLNGSTPDAGSLAGILAYEKVFGDFDSGGFRTNEFDGCSGLDLMCWVASSASHNHAANGGVWTDWNGADIPSSYLKTSEAWWTPLLAQPTPAPPGAPNWANAERDYARAYRAGIAWWIANRAKNGEFGGGSGDDPELVAVLGGPLLSLHQPADDSARATLLDAADVVLDGKNVSDGYYSGDPIDVEHSAELTSYPIRTGLGIAPGDPHYLQAALDVTKHVQYPGNSAKSWALADGAGNLRFQAFYFNSDGPAPATDPNYSQVFVDVPLDGKALLPAYEVLSHAKLAVVGDAVRAWANSWASASLSTTSSRPLGLVPAAISTGVNGAAPAEWWLATMDLGASYNYPANLQSLAFLYSGAFFSAYEQGGPAAYQYLVPSIELAKAVIALNDAIKAGQSVSGLTTVGTTNWALDQLRNSSSFLDNLATLRPSIATDASLRTIDDPYQVGTAPYVTDSFISAIDALLFSNDFSALSYLAVAQTGPNPAALQYTRKGKIAILSQLQGGANWLRNHFPLGTTEALYTDRAFLFQGESHRTLHCAMTGDLLGSAVPRPIVTWEAPPASTKPLDIGVLVNDLAVKEGTTNTRLRILLYNFEATPRNVDFRLWNRLPFGKYHQRIGVADPNTDYFASGYSASDITYDRVGTKLSISLPPQSLQLLELEWFGSVAAPYGFDLAVSDHDTKAILTGSAASSYSVTVSTIVYNAALTVAPANTALLYASLLDPSGKPIPLNQAGATEVELPLPQNHPALPALTGLAIPNATLTYSLPLPGNVVTLLLQGNKIRFRFQVAIGVNGDLHPHNDSASVAFGW